MEAFVVHLLVEEDFLTLELLLGEGWVGVWPLTRDLRLGFADIGLS